MDDANKVTNASKTKPITVCIVCTGIKTVKMDRDLNTVNMTINQEQNCIEINMARCVSSEHKSIRPILCTTTVRFCKNAAHTEFGARQHTQAPNYVTRIRLRYILAIVWCREQNSLVLRTARCTRLSGRQHWCLVQWQPVSQSVHSSSGT